MNQEQNLKTLDGFFAYLEKRGTTAADEISFHWKEYKKHTEPSSSSLSDEVVKGIEGLRYRIGNGFWNCEAVRDYFDNDKRKWIETRLIEQGGSIIAVNNGLGDVFKIGDDGQSGGRRDKIAEFMLHPLGGSILFRFEDQEKIWRTVGVLRKPEPAFSFPCEDGTATDKKQHVYLCAPSIVDNDYYTQTLTAEQAEKLVTEDKRSEWHVFIEQPNRDEYVRLNTKSLSLNDVKEVWRSIKANPLTDYGIEKQKLGEKLFAALTGKIKS